MILHDHARQKNYGLSLIEVVVGAALFAFVAFMLNSVFGRVFVVARAAQERVDAMAVGIAQMEIVRNLSYENVGTIGGIPQGTLPQVKTIVTGGKTYTVTTTVRNVDFPFDGTLGGTPNDLSPADNKLVAIELTCTSCQNFTPLTLTATVAPRGLENSTTNGSLFVQVIDAKGDPVSGATVRVINNSLAQKVDLTDVTNGDGMLALIDAPPSAQAYDVHVSMPGYSSDQTRGAPTTTNPVTPHATVVAQTVTQLTLAIDRTATLNVSSVSPSCTPIPNTSVELQGAKLIATTPDIPKNDIFFSTGPTGATTVNDVEWDLYTMSASSSAYEVAGVIPLFPLSVLPGGTQEVQLVMVPKNDPSLVVTVKDLGTGLPITGATVTIDDGNHSPITQTTGRGYMRQTDWMNGNGQADFVDESAYAVDDGNVDVVSNPGVVALKNTLTQYATDGVLESSTFDTGSPANFYQFNAQPTAQPGDPDLGDARAEFQIATGNSTSSWSYLGPDGTPDTFFNSTTTNLGNIFDGKRYLRYKMYLHTASTTLTPTVSDVEFTFTSACVAPGTVIFQNPHDGNYTVTVSAAGYQIDTSNVSIGHNPSWQEKIVTLAP